MCSGDSLCPCDGARRPGDGCVVTTNPRQLNCLVQPWFRHTNIYENPSLYDPRAALPYSDPRYPPLHPSYSQSPCDPHQH
ncbi:hypothetical protein BV25DRAFT_1366096 [Artomyces pyxidatus]|uniref:Uncharacterized protein n=1 Tax=Artomyces pyxidatus TaxID=48021 RepID=A0ACB8SP69_9AGAM|nr:hypothetical protein BV25DRAFT_1366096 [Artomyces pyxidatus]